MDYSIFYQYRGGADEGDFQNKKNAKFSNIVIYKSHNFPFGMVAHFHFQLQKNNNENKNKVKIKAKVRQIKNK